MSFMGLCRLPLPCLSPKADGVLRTSAHFKQKSGFRHADHKTVFQLPSSVVYAVINEQVRILWLHDSAPAISGGASVCLTTRFRGRCGTWTPDRSIWFAPDTLRLVVPGVSGTLTVASSTGLSLPQIERVTIPKASALIGGVVNGTGSAQCTRCPVCGDGAWEFALCLNTAVANCRRICILMTCIGYGYEGVSRSTTPMRSGSRWRHVWPAFEAGGPLDNDRFCADSERA